MIVLASCMIGIALSKTLGAVDEKIDDQIKLDQCTGSFILNLRAATLALKFSYDRLQKEKLIVLAACSIPSPACIHAQSLFVAAAKIEKGIQTGVKHYWNGQKATWNLDLSCKGSIRAKSDFPEFDFPIASGTLSDLTTSWSDLKNQNLPETIHLSVQSTRNRSGAKMKRTSSGWAVRWNE